MGYSFPHPAVRLAGSSDTGTHSVHSSPGCCLFPCAQGGTTSPQSRPATSGGRGAQIEARQVVSYNPFRQFDGLPPWSIVLPAWSPFGAVRRERPRLRGVLRRAGDRAPEGRRGAPSRRRRRRHRPQHHLDLRPHPRLHRHQRRLPELIRLSGRGTTRCVYLNKCEACPISTYEVATKEQCPVVVDQPDVKTCSYFHVKGG